MELEKVFPQNRGQQCPTFHRFVVFQGIHLNPLYQGAQDGAFAVYDLQKNDSSAGFTVSASYDSSSDDPAQGHCQLRSLLDAMQLNCF